MRGVARATRCVKCLHTPFDESLHAAFNALQRELNARGDDLDEDDLPPNYDVEDDPVPFQLHLVNAVRGQEEYPLREDYLTLLENHYGGSLQEADYKSDPEVAREEIKGGVDCGTHERSRRRVGRLLRGSSTDLRGENPRL